MNEKLPVLSKRLEAIAKMVTPGNRVADIGCDHGYVSIWLVNSGTSPCSIASDINEGPLKRAEENAALFGASESVSLRLGSGLETVKPGEADTVLISGMGGLMIKEILEKSPETVSSASELVLSPQSDAYEVRKYLEQAAFTITDEAFILDEGKYYPVIKAANRPPERKMTEAERTYGPVLLARRDETVLGYLSKRKSLLEEILEKLRDNTGTTAVRRRRELAEDLYLVEQILSGAGDLKVDDP